MQAFASRKAARIAQHEIVILRAVEALAQSAQRRQAVAAKEGEMVRVVHAGQQRGIEGGLQEQIDRPQATIGDDFVRVEKKAARGGGQGAPNPIERERRQRIVVIEERQPRRARSRDAGVRRRGDAAICGMPQDAQIRRLGMAIEPVAGRLGLRTVVAQNQFPGARPLRAHRGDQFVEIPWMGVEDRNDERNKRRCERRPIGLLGGERDDVGEKRGGAGPIRPQLQPRRQVFEGAAKRIDNVSSHLVTRPKMQSTCGRRFPSMEFHFYIRSAPIFGSALASSIARARHRPRASSWSCDNARLGEIALLPRNCNSGLVTAVAETRGSDWMASLSLAKPVATPCPIRCFWSRIEPCDQQPRSVG